MLGLNSGAHKSKDDASLHHHRPPPPPFKRRQTLVVLLKGRQIIRIFGSVYVRWKLKMGVRWTDDVLASITVYRKSIFTIHPLHWNANSTNPAALLDYLGLIYVDVLSTAHSGIQK